MENKLPSVSVIIPTYNRHDLLGDTLKDIIGQDYPNFDIIIVEQSATCSSETLSLAKSYSQKIKLFHVNFKGLPTARNFGMQMSESEYIIFIDDDIRCDSHFLTSHMSTFVTSGAAIQGGGVEEKFNAQHEVKLNDIGRFNKWTATPITGFQFEVQKQVDHVKGCNFGIRKSAIEKIKGFDESLNPASALYEELDLCLRGKKNNLKVYFNGKARLTHLAAASGGCRIPDIKRYLWSLSRNRTLIIRRHLSLVNQITAFCRLALLQISHAVTYKSLGAFFSAMKGLSEGLKVSQLSPSVTRWTKEEGRRFLIGF